MTQGYDEGVSAIGYAAAVVGWVCLLLVTNRRNAAMGERERQAQRAEFEAAARHRAEMAHARERLAAQQIEVDAAFHRFQRQRVRLSRRSAARLRPAQRRMLLRP